MKPSIFQIGIILLFSIILLFPSNAFSEKIKDPEDKKAKLKEEMKKKFLELKYMVQEKDTIPVIIGLNTDYKVEGKLTSSKINTQKDKIRQDQDSLIGFLSNYKVDNIHKFKHISAIAMNVDRRSLERLESSPLVSMISEDILHEALLTQSVPLVGAPAAWISGASGQGQAVAVLDSGVEKTHSMLSGKIIAEACFSSDETSPFVSSSVCPGGGEEETGSGTGVPCLVNGCDHGTHVAGIVAGNDVTIQGVAKDANIISIQIFSEFPNQSECKTLPTPCILAYTSDIVKGLDHVMTLSNTLDISSVNLSIGGGSYTSEAACDTDPNNFFLKQLIDQLRYVGIATVASSGNDGSDDSLITPACISSAISVGSTTKLDVVSSFSNSAIFLDLLAPGSSITSSILNNQFGVKSGTSFAAPHVAGAWAILKSGDNSATVVEVLNSLKNTGFLITDSRNGFSFPRIQVNDALNDLVSPSATPWYDTNWQLRKEITINSAQVASTLTDFPVLISMTDTDLGSLAQVDGDDILFTAGDGVTQLSHEIESWNDTPDKLVAWVNTPSLSAVTDTKIYMYYGNAAAANQEDIAGTWNSNYKAVYHLHDDFLDSTGNNNDGTNGGSTDILSQIADGQSFDGVDDIITVSSQPSHSFIFGNGGTTTVWINPSSAGENNQGRVFQKSVTNIKLQNPSVDTSDIRLTQKFDGTHGVWKTTNRDIAFNQWNHIAITYDASSIINDPTFYINGIPMPITENSSPSGLAQQENTGLRIGNAHGSTRTFDGTVDEFRIYDGILSNGWIQTEFNNQNNPTSFYTVGTQEAQ